MVLPWGWRVGDMVRLTTDRATPSLNGRGLGEAEFAPALTSAGAEAMLDEGMLPYYGTSASNIPSMRTAITVGFKPTWVEVLSPPSED